MPTKPKNGSIVHVEFVSEDPKATRKFYEGVFGWTFKVDKANNYTMFKAKGAPHGGMRQPMGPGDNAGTIGYIQVASVDKTIAKVEKAGGKVVMPKTTVPKMGSMAVFIVPGGVVQGVWSNEF